MSISSAQVARNRAKVRKKQRASAPKQIRQDYMMPPEVKARGVDKALFFCFFVILVVGLVVLYSASFYKAQDEVLAASEQLGTGFEILLKQLVNMAVGAVGFFIMMNFDYHKLQNPSIILASMVASVLLLIVVLLHIPGVVPYLNGAWRWIRIGPLSIQPSEIAKFAVILYVAAVLSRQPDDIAHFGKGVLRTLIFPALIFFLILKQPNLSTAGSILIVSVLMVFAAGAKLSHMGVIGIAGSIVAWYYANSEEYRQKRLLSFLDPWKDPKHDGYQLIQSLIAVGSGGLFGAGLGQGRQKYAFLPYAESDFIFAVIAEDWGFVGCVVVIALFVAFVVLGLRVAARSPDRFGALLATGITAMIGVQTALHIAVVIGAFPTTGLPLPFFSSGGTSLSLFMAAVGVLLNISRYSTKKT